MTEAERAAADKAKADAEEKERDEKEKADKAKADADAGAQPDKILAALDSMGKRLDDMGSMCDSMKKRFDAEDERREADEKAKKDAEEEERKGKMSEEEREKADKAKKDAEEDREREEKAKADAETIAQLGTDLAATQKQLTAITGMMTERSPEDRAAFARVQSVADTVYQAFGDSAPRPLLGEDLLDYRRRLAGSMQTHSKTWSGIKLGTIDADTLAVAEGGIYADALEAAKHPTGLEPGQLVERRRNIGGREVIEWVGNGTFIGAMKRPSQRATGSFLTGKGN